MFTEIPKILSLRQRQIFSVVALTLLVTSLSATMSFGAEPLGVPDLESIEYPDDEPHSAEEIELGKTLFFDTRLSENNNTSCATCHNPDLGFGDGMPVGIGTQENMLPRNTPHLYNLAWNSVFFWDGRASSLEEQALGPIQAEGEMNMPLNKLLPKLKKVPYYVETFNEIYPDDGMTAENIARAIAAFERTIITNNSPFDRYIQGDKTAMSPAAIRGLELFKGKAACIKCHDGSNFTDESFHNIAVGDNDPGRGNVIKDASMKGKFKTPGLRNVLLTAPYMHDGSLETLRDVIDFYNVGGKSQQDQVSNKGSGLTGISVRRRKSSKKDASTVSELIEPLHLNDRETSDLIAFLGALTEPIEIERPAIPLAVDTTIINLGEVTDLPRYQQKVDPKYPALARESRKEGQVTLEALIDTDGRAKEIKVVNSLGFGLDEAAIEALENSRFTPAKKAQEPVAVRVNIPYWFALDDSETLH